MVFTVVYLLLICQFGNISDPRYHDLTTQPSLNWLIHILYARQDYKQCLAVIEHQFKEAYDHEYLYFIKVRPWNFTIE